MSTLQGQPPDTLSDPHLARRGPVGPPGGRLHVCVVVGTRPEAIKLAPVIHELRHHRDSVHPTVVTTALHREMLAQALEAFAIVPDVDLALLAPRRAHADFTSRALAALTSCFAELRPDLVLVQGDNSTVLAASLAAHYLGVPIGHVEAGIRSGSVRDPFPEELNRRLASVVADLHFAPTEHCRDNLLREGVSEERIHVTGNTVVDAVRRQGRKGYFTEPALNQLPWEKRRVILVTLHRRELAGEAVVNICRAIVELVATHPDLHVVFPLHLDPRVRDIASEVLSATARIDLLEPLVYGDLIEVVRRCEFAMTDSGGLQEECATIGRPVLILRKGTDRPEIVDAGFGLVVGADPIQIIDAGSRLLADDEELERMSSGENPFGDGRAAARIVHVLLSAAPKSAGGTLVPEGPAPLPPLRSVER